MTDDLPRRRANVAALQSLDFDTLLVGDRIYLLEGTKAQLEEPVAGPRS